MLNEPAGKRVGPARHFDGPVEVAVPPGRVAPNAYRAVPRNANAKANGAPMMKFPLVGSPWAKSMTFCV